MAQFEPAFEQMIRDEGGYVLHEVPGDTGGMTYAGIARNKNPQWNGWALVDKKEFGGSLFDAYGARVLPCRVLGQDAWQRDFQPRGRQLHF